MKYIPRNMSHLELWGESGLKGGTGGSGEKAGRRKRRGGGNKSGRSLVKIVLKLRYNGWSN